MLLGNIFTLHFAPCIPLSLIVNGDTAYDLSIPPLVKDHDLSQPSSPPHALPPTSSVKYKDRRTIISGRIGAFAFHIPPYLYIRRFHAHEGRMVYGS